MIPKNEIWEENKIGIEGLVSARKGKSFLVDISEIKEWVMYENQELIRLIGNMCVVYINVG